uniref:Choline/carnitine acyltransferase domain-containing protein n=1 Tax=Oncorhynchus mykiss TaxID=8022 RepID=A0A8C7RP66_ONCMY
MPRFQRYTISQRSFFIFTAQEKICNVVFLVHVIHANVGFLMPVQPVPPLAQTLQGYLRALEPLIPKEELVHTRKKIQMFCGEGGLGLQLQEGLERRARHLNNWICKQCGKLQPLTMHSNPAISLTKWDFSDWRGQRV